MIPTATAEDVFLRVLLQAQAKNEAMFDTWVSVTEIMVAAPDLNECCHGDSRLVPGGVFKLVERLAKRGLLEFDMDHKAFVWFFDTTRVKLTALGVYSAMLLEPVTA